MAPFFIELLLHFYAQGDRHRCHGEGVEMYEETVERWLEQGVIVECDWGYKTTDLGNAWVTEICRTPLPTVQYVNEAGNIINT